jgi:YVTN family beta-propeller protein
MHLKLVSCTLTVLLPLLCEHTAMAASTVLATLTVGQTTQGIAIDPNLGLAFVSNNGSGTVSVINIANTNIVATIPVGSSPRDLISDSATSRVYVVTDTSPGAITIIDEKTLAVSGTIPVGNDPRQAAADFLIGELYVTNRADNTLSVINLATNTVTAVVPVVAAPGGVSVNHTLGKIHVVSNGVNAISIVDQATHAAVRVAVGTMPVGVGVDERSGHVYVHNVVDDTVSVVDSASGAVIATLPVGFGTSANTVSVSAVYHRAYIANYTDNTVNVINTDTVAAIQTINVGREPQDVVVDRNGGDLYAVNQFDDTVSVINAGTNVPITTFGVGGSPWRAAVALDLQRVLVLNQRGNQPDTVSIASTQDTLPDTAVATEFYHAAFNHYFHSATEVETTLLQDGLFGDNWNRTFEYWRVWTAAGPGRYPVCRFFSATFGQKSSHFFTPYAAECASLQQGNVWTYEGTVYYVGLPDGAGSCSAGTAALYRVYNNGMGGAPNHRYTPDRAVRDHMVAQGWIAEGSGPDIVFACTPTLLNG